MTALSAPAERAEAAPDAEAASAPPKLDQYGNIPLPDGDTAKLGSLAYWLQDVDQSRDRIKEEIKGWKTDLSTYAGERVKLPGLADDDVINVNVPFYVAEQKKPELVYQTPFVNVKSLQRATDQAAPLVQAIINDKLSRNGVNVNALMDEVLTDLTVTSGIGPTKIGYDCIRVDITVPTPRVDGMGQPVLDPTTNQPIIDQVASKKTIFSNYYWRRISPADFRIPAGFTSSRYSEAPWLGQEFNLDAATIEKFELEGAGESLQSELSLIASKDRRALEGAPRAIEIFYKAYLYDASVRNPDLVRQLVIVPGRKQKRADGKAAGTVLVHRDSPHQQFDKDGKLVAGAKGFPFKVFTLRPMPESAYPSSDAKVLRDVGAEKSMGRSLMVQQRKRNLPMVAANKKRVDRATIDQIERGQVQSIIFTNGDPNDLLVPLGRSNFPPENFSFDGIAQQDIDRLSGLGPNQQAMANPDSDTATEANIIDKRADSRIGKERDRVLDTMLEGIEYLFALLQLFTDHEDAVEILGQDGAAVIETWDKTKIQGRYGFSLKPDSSMRSNQAEDRELFLRLFNLVANHPAVDTVELLRMVVAKFNVDPAKVVKGMPPPDASKERPKVSVSAGPEWFNPALPWYDGLMDFLAANGYTIPDSLRNARPAPGAPTTMTEPGGGHDGLLTSLKPVPPVDQHQADLTGKQPGPGPM